MIAPQFPMMHLISSLATFSPKLGVTYPTPDDVSTKD